MVTAEASGDPMVEGKCIPGKTAILTKRGGNPLEGAASVSPGSQVQERTEWAVDQPGRFVEDEVSHVDLTKVELHAGFDGTGTSLVQHSC